MTTTSLPYYAHWPRIESVIAPDPQIEQLIDDILVQMTLEEKVGQMVQPDLREVTAEEARDYKLGSVLNGGGGWPGDNKHASAMDWARTSESFYQAVEEHYATRPFRVPFMWATDAVHGHNNAFRATVFPHNIGLGAARDPELIERIGRATAVEIAVTGLDWTFAPTVATPRDYRWGRVYEGYSEDPEIVYTYAGRMVRGLQGNAEELKGEHHVLSNVKHWVGDGGTLGGVDRGVNNYSEDQLRNIHAMGYFSGLEAGAQVVMASFNSWEDEANYDLSPDDGEHYNRKIHGSKYLLTDVLKEQMGFDGLVVSDWNGHSEISKCCLGDAGYAINAGIDILMVTVRADWQSVWHTAVDQVNSGVIPMTRIDDAVRRILRVKMRAGLWQKKPPTQRLLAGREELLGCDEHRALAREAVRKSLVLLKNEDQILPLKRDRKVIIAGSGAHDIQKQTGGWSLTWLGTENQLEDFPGATTLKMALEQELGTENCLYDPLAEQAQTCGAEVAIVAIGEDPYAEMMGDLKPWQSLEFSSIKKSYARDCEIIARLKAAGKKVITIFYSGRPLYLNQEINLSDAFIAAWLPGSEAGGITDLLLRDAQGQVQHDFVGKLSFSWPMKKRSTTINRTPVHIPNYQAADHEQDILGEHKPLFDYGYGLAFGEDAPEILRQPLPLDLDQEDEGELGLASYPLELMGRESAGDFIVRVADQSQWFGTDVSANSPTQLQSIRVEPLNYQHQQDARALSFSGMSAMFYVLSEDLTVADRRDYLAAGARLEFDVRLHESPERPVLVSVHQEPTSQPCQDIQPLLLDAPKGEWVTLSLPLGAMAEQGVDFRHINTPFMLATDGRLKLDLGNNRWALSKGVDS